MKPKPDQLAEWMQEADIDAVPVGGYYVGFNALAELAELAYKAGIAADWRLRAQNLELVEALNKIKAHMDTDEYAWEVAAAALAKAQGENNDGMWMR